MQNTSQIGAPVPTLSRLRGAATPHGPEYEYKLAGLLALRLRRRGLPFQVFTNVAAARPLDDIVLRVLGPTVTTVLIQLKHASSTPAPTITTQAFTTPRGDFVLRKYFDFFEGFANLRAVPFCMTEEQALLHEGEMRLVIYTNRPVARRRAIDGPHLPFDLEGILRTDAASASAVFSFGPSDSEVWNLFVNDPQNDNYLYEFLPRLRVFSEQVHSDGLDELIREELDAMFGGPLPRSKDMLASYLALLRAWALEDAQGRPLTESSGEVERLLLQDLAEQGQSAAGGGALLFQQHECSALRRLLRASQRAAHVQVAGAPAGLRAAKLLQVLQEDAPGRWAYVGGAALRDFPPAALEAACGAGHVLVLDQAEEQLEQAGRLLASALATALQVVVVSSGPMETALESCAPRWTTLHEDWRLHQLTAQAQNTFLDRPILFQGVEMPLRALEAAWPSVREDVDGPLLCALARGGAQAMGAAPAQPETFLPRTLEHPAALDPSLLKQLDPRRHHFVLSGFSRTFLQRLHEELGEQEEGAGRDIWPDANIPDMPRWTIVSSDDAAEAAFQKACEAREAVSVHWLQSWGEESPLRVGWLRTRGAEAPLAPFVLPATGACGKARTCVHAAAEAVGAAAAWGPRVGLLAGEPGMGKSLFLQRLAAEARARAPHRWAVLLQALHHDNLLQDFPDPEKLREEHVLELLAAAVGAEAEAARRSLQAALHHSGQIVVFIDGVDEVCPAFKHKLLQLIKLLLRTKVQLLWVSTRPEIQVALSEALGCPPSRLRPLTEAEQESFLCSEWASADAARRPPAQLQGLAAEVVAALRSAAGSHRRSLLDVPLHAQMAAEAFAAQAAQALSAGDTGSLLGGRHMSLLDLYRGFVQQKRSVYMARFGLTDARFKNLPLRDNFQEDHEYSAMFVLILGGAYGNIDQICFKEYLEKNKEQLTKERTGILWLRDDGMPQFLHYSFLEYFAASWIVSNLGLDIAKKMWLALLEQDAEVGLRQMLERMLAENLPLHRAVLEGSEPALEAASCDPNAIDRFGRTALHQAASLGRAGAVDALLAKGYDPELKDTELGWTALRYASACGQVPAAERLLHAGADPTHLVFQDKEAAAFQAAELGCAKIMNILVNLGVDINSKRSSNTLLNISAINGHVMIVRLLLENGADLHQSNEDMMTALHFASQQAHSDVMDLLINEGADVDAKNNTGGTPLMYASKSGNTSAVRLLLKRGADILQSDGNKWSAMHFASHMGHHEIMELLIEEGADADAKNRTGTTPMMYASSSGNTSAVRLLLQHDVDFRQGSKHQITAMHFASKMGHCEIMKLLIDEGADVDAKGDIGRTSLMYASMSGNPSAVRLLLQRGADLRLNDENMMTALHFASNEGHCEIMEILMNEGADVEAKSNTGTTPLTYAALSGNPSAVRLLLQRGADLHQRSNNRMTALHLASDEGLRDIMEVLIDEGTDANVQDNTHTTPLMYASMNGNASAVRLLLHRGADLRQCDENMMTALHFASNMGQHDVMMLLVDEGADVDAKDNKGRTPLMYASISGNASTVRLLLQRGGDIRQSDENMMTALHFASNKGHCEIMNLLMKEGTDADVKSNSGTTPLMYASISGNSAAVRLLLQRGADLHQSDKNMMTALHFASNKGHCEIMEILMNEGADVEAKNNTGTTPLTYAALSGNPSAVRLLLQRGVNVRQIDVTMMTALHFASKNGHCDIMKILIDEGSTVDAKNITGVTPLMSASMSGNTSATRLLLQCGADLGLKDKNMMTALHFATNDGHCEIMEILIDEGADTNAKNNTGITPLMYASLGGNTSAVRLLLQRGADLHLSDENMMTALHFASNKGHCEIMEILMDEGADAEAKNNTGLTPLMYTAMSGDASATHQ